jgi:hypothetical protein
LSSALRQLGIGLASSAISGFGFTAGNGGLRQPGKLGSGFVAGKRGLRHVI